MPFWGTVEKLTPEGARFLLQLAALKSKPYVKIGVLQEDYEKPKAEDKSQRKLRFFDNPVTLGQVAVWNEFGTSDGRIPERSFIRTTVDAHGKGDWAREAEALKKRIVEGRMTTDQALLHMGLLIKKQIQEKIRSSVPPPNASSTIAAKGSDKTLIDTGQLLNSIDFELHRNGDK